MNHLQPPPLPAIDIQHRAELQGRPPQITLPGMTPLAHPVALRAGARVLRVPGLHAITGPLALRWSRAAASHVDAAARRQRGTVAGATLELDLREPNQANAFLHGTYEPHVVDTIRGRLPARGVFVDAGANIGLISLGVAHRSDVTVHAVEAHPGNAAALRRNIALNPSADVIVHEVALAATPGTVRLELGAESGHHHVGSTGIPVRAETLDRVLADLPRVDVLKMDIEGAEVAALHGARELLEQRRVRAIVCEVIDWHLRQSGVSARELHELLASYNFRASPIMRRRLLRPAGATDEVLFTL